MPPAVILAATLGSFLIEQQRETFRRGTEDRLLALSTAVDSELKRSIDTLRALAQSGASMRATSGYLLV
jgi:hypothetical protein